MSCIQIWADQRNQVTVSIGPKEMTVASNSRPNRAYFQLDSGRDAVIYTDDVYTEFFDLAQFYAAQPDASNTWFLYLTIWTPKPV